MATKRKIKEAIEKIYPGLTTRPRVKRSRQKPTKAELKEHLQEMYPQLKKPKIRRSRPSNNSAKLNGYWGGLKPPSGWGKKGTRRKRPS